MPRWISKWGIWADG
jgi:hypothetical protein